MPTLIDTPQKLSSYTVAKVVFVRDNNNYITSIYAYDKLNVLFYHYLNPYGVRSNKRANALRTLVLQHSSAFYLYYQTERMQIFFNNRLPLIKK